MSARRRGHLQFFFLNIIIAFCSNLEIKAIYVIVVVISSQFVSSPTVGELTVTDKQQQLARKTKKGFLYLAATAEIKNSFHVSGW